LQLEVRSFELELELEPEEKQVALQTLQVALQTLQVALQTLQVALQTLSFPRYLPSVNALRRNTLSGSPFDINTLRNPAKGPRRLNQKVCGRKSFLNLLALNS